MERAVAFIEAHQSCESDADCRVVHDRCGQIPGSYCDQIEMNREGAESAQWKTIEAELHDCGPNECAVCLAALIPGCHEGSCGYKSGAPPGPGDGTQ